MLSLNRANKHEVNKTPHPLIAENGVVRGNPSSFAIPTERSSESDLSENLVNVMTYSNLRHSNYLLKFLQTRKNLLPSDPLRNISCVLRIGVASHRCLLPKFIEHHGVSSK